MMSRTRVAPRRKTSRELIEATGLGARMAARHRRTRGLDEDAIRAGTLAYFRGVFADGFVDEYECETLMAVVRRSIEEVLAEPVVRPIVG